MKHLNFIQMCVLEALLHKASKSNLELIYTFEFLS